MTDKEQIIYTEEICPYCDRLVELPPFKGIYECPECKELIVCCSMCQEQSCNDCKYTLLTQSKESLARKTQECEELKRKLSNQEQLYQNEIEIYNKSCLQLRQENDDLYLERLALNTANSGINALLEVKEQESNRYRKAFEEIEEYVQSQLDGFGNDVYLMNKAAINKILDIINNAKEKNNVTV